MKIPFVKVVYNFGVELVDSFVADTKGDGELAIVEFDWDGSKSCLGILTDEANHIVASALVPNPMTGFLFKFNSADEYRITDMTMGEFLKIVGSIGKLGGSRWK